MHAALRIAAAAAATGLAAGSLACAGSLGERAEVVRGKVVGLRARSVLNCMGPPADFDYETQDHAIWVYVRPLATPGSQTVTSRRPGQTGPRGPRTLPPVTIGGDPEIEDDTPQSPWEWERRSEPEPFGKDERDYGYCKLSFEIHDDVVTGFEAVGRTSQGLNADAACTMQASACVTPPRAR